MIMDDSLRAVRRALIIFLAAVLVSVLAALTMIGSAAITRSRAWSVIGGLLVAALVSWILGSRILRRDRKAQRLVIGPLVVLGCAGGHQLDLALSGYWRRTPGSRCGR